jgi:hypothetical protein
MQEWLNGKIYHELINNTTNVCFAGKNVYGVSWCCAQNGHYDALLARKQTCLVM